MSKMTYDIITNVFECSEEQGKLLFYDSLSQEQRSVKNMYVL